MGYREAIEDGIRRSGTSPSNRWYYPKCHECGEEVSSWNYSRGVKYTCSTCKEKAKLFAGIDREQSKHESKEKKFENAVGRIFKKARRKDQYYHAIEAIKKQLHNPGWFDSTEEIMVAIELVKNKVKAKHQVSFGRYRADFVLTDEKIVLEVDGVLFHPKTMLQKEQARDGLIVLTLGPEWEVIRVSDEMVNQNITRLLPAIRAIKKKREILRKKNQGALPKWYSDRK